MRKTKIICTVGPATDREGVLEQLIKEGMDVARLNFSHGSHEEHKVRMDKVKEIRAAQGKPVAILLDTKGPEIRVTSFKEGKVQLVTGQEFRLRIDDAPGDEKSVPITYKDLYKDVKKGDRILIDDGLIEMIVTAIEKTVIVCEVKNDGAVSNNKGINVPGVPLSMPYISERDKADILFGIEQEVDFIAASFVSTADEIIEIRQLLEKNGGKGINIIAKIENQHGVDNINSIIEVADSIMIARGDMGVEIDCEDVPAIQKKIIKKSYEAGKQVITATQMLDSMIKNPRPTRAETTDVANAIYDGTSCIMLSGETAAGLYPVEALRMMVKIATKTEKDIDYEKRFFSHPREANPNITDAICHATCTTALDLNAAAIIAVTMSGNTARMLSRYRPACDIIGCTTDERVSRQINLSWGVRPVLINQKQETFGLFEHALGVAEMKGFVKRGDITVITSGVPIGVSGTTNMIKVQVI